MPVTTNEEGGVLDLQKLREAAHGDSYLMLYKAALDAGVFVYVYLRPETCSLVWKGTQDGQLDITLPFEFFDTQFSKKSPSRVNNIKRPVEKYGSSMVHIPYKFTKHRVTLFLAGEDRLREYDLANKPDTYMAEIVDNSDVRMNIAFARFDAKTEYQGNREDLKGHRVSYSLTFERLGDSSSNVWEFAVSIPRDLRLEVATLRWIAKHHTTKEMRRMAFTASLSKLSELLKPQTDQIHV
jgi:hypothetical protein